MDVLLTYLLSGIYFFITVLVAFFIPGNLFLSRLKLPRIVMTSSSIVLGMSLWIIQGLIFGYLTLRELTYIYLILTSLAWVILNYKNFNFKKRVNLKIKLDKLDLIAIVVLIIGIILQINTTVYNALYIKEGLFFCCGGADTLYHGALVNELIKNFPPSEPAIANLMLKNYHYLSNLAVADLIRVFKLPILYTEFNLIPIFMSIMFSITAYSAARILNLGKKFIIFFLFLIFFFSDIFYILTLLTSQKLAFNISTIEISQSLWVSYSRFFSVVFFLQAFTFLVIWIQKKDFKNFLPLLLCSGILIGIKVYIGILFLAGLGFLVLYLFYKKDFKSVIQLVSIFVLSALVFLPVNSSSGGLIFSGLWRTRDLFANSYTNLNNLELARRVFEQAGNPKRYFFDSVFIFLYIFFSFGILLTSFLNPLKNIKRINNEINIFLISGFIVTFILGMFFIQKTGGANSSQFLISIYLIGSIYAALFFDYLYSKNNKIFNLLVIILLLIMLPKTIYTSLSLPEKINKNQYLFFDKNTLDSFKYINHNIEEKSILVVDPGLKDTCILIPIFTHSKTFYCNSGSPSDRGIDSRKYDQVVKEILGNKELKLNNIDYIIATKGAVPSFFIQIYSNDKYQILNFKNN